MIPEHLRALVILLVLATVVFAIVKEPACETATRVDDFTRRRNLWYGLTVSLFLAHNFWIYIIVAALVLSFAVAYDTNKLALYYIALFAAPMISAEITGLGLIRHFFAIDHARLLSLTVLFPALLSLWKRSDSEPVGRSLPDKLLLAYLLLQFFLMLKVSTFTNTLRIGAFYAFIDVFLPYYVASRSLKQLAQFRDALMAFAVAALLLATIGCFELTRHWLLYGAVDGALGERWGYGHYLGRGENLRALASTGQPIALGFVLMIGLTVFFYLKRSVTRTGAWSLGVFVLACGIMSTVSRGPWMGAAAALVVFAALGPNPVRVFGKVLLSAIILTPVILATPAGDTIYKMLPFVGTVDETTVFYRQRLLEIALQVIWNNPFFGAYDFIYSPAFQELKQGEGIIDIVNTYVGIGLSSGLIGLSLFLGFFVVVAFRIWKTMRGLNDANSELYLLGRTLLAIMVGIHVTIFTVSSITVIPLLYWSMAGIGLAYVRFVAPSADKVAVQTIAARPLLSAQPGV